MANLCEITDFEQDLVKACSDEQDSNESSCKDDHIEEQLTDILSDVHQIGELLDVKDRETSKLRDNNKALKSEVEELKDQLKERNIECLRSQNAHHSLKRKVNVGNAQAKEYQEHLNSFKKEIFEMHKTFQNLCCESDRLKEINRKLLEEVVIDGKVEADSHEQINIKDCTYSMDDGDTITNEESFSQCQKSTSLLNESANFEERSTIFRQHKSAVEPKNQDINENDFNLQEDVDGFREYTNKTSKVLSERYTQESMNGDDMELAVVENPTTGRQKSWQKVETIDCDINGLSIRAKLFGQSIFMINNFLAN